MASGIKIADAVKETYQQISMNTTKSKKLKYAVFKFSDNEKEIVVESTATADEANNDYDALISSLPEKDVRYVAYDFEYLTKEGNPKSEMLLVSWHPEHASIRKKMICASSFNSLKTALSVNKNAMQGDSFAEVDSQAALAKLGGKPKE